MNPPSADCCAEPGNKLISIEEGLSRILSAVAVVEHTEQLHLRAALDRTLAENVIAKQDVPPFDNSAMDGYALRSKDCGDQPDTRLEVIGTAFAGAPFNGRVERGQCLRIMTGAVMPEGTDAVVMQEHVRRNSDRITFATSDVSAGLNVRYAGEDTRSGDTVLEAGVSLGAAELGLLASVGISEVRVKQRPRVAFFSTGDELCSAGTALKKGQIYDSNRYALYGLLSGAGVEFFDLGTVPDRREAVQDAFRQAGEMADLVITSGGVSVGEADYVTETLQKMGQIDFWRMAMKPGKPLAFGRIGEAVFLGLPGNPVSAMVTFYRFVLPAIRKMRGLSGRDDFLMEARSETRLKKSAGRAEFQRGVLKRQADGGWSVASTGQQSSHLLSSMARANCLILLPAENSGVEAGQLVTVQPFLDFQD
jgi:molybdopterin molybdotransferase